MAEGKSTNELAYERNEMSFGRTYLALERTLMAWIRTAMSLIGFGFTIYKFLEAMAQKGGQMRENAPRNMGLFLIFMGMGILVLAIFQFNRGLKTFSVFSEMKPPLPLSLVAAAGVLLVGILATVNILFGFGEF